MDVEALQEHDPRKRCRLASPVPVGSIAEVSVAKWQEDVTQLLSSPYAPKLIVFDLDNTVSGWLLMCIS